MRYIDADKELYNLSDDLPYKASVRRVLMQAPEADVAEVVRCSECKHLEIINKVPIYAKCKKHGIVFELWQEDTREHYCSWGERRKENE